MKTIKLLLKDLREGWHDFVEKYDLFIIRIIFLVLSYLLSFIVIGVIWYIYELIVLGNINQNSRDTAIAFVLSLILMLPIADAFNRKIEE